VFRGRKTLLFWFGLSVLALASTGLFLMLGLIFIYYPTHYQQMHWDYLTYFPSYFWQYYIWQIIGAAALAAAGFFMMKAGTKKTHAQGSSAHAKYNIWEKERHGNKPS